MGPSDEAVGVPPVGGTAITTFSGKTLDLKAPAPESIDIEDIIAGLSKVCRFGGQSRRFYSVAQHAVGVSRTVSELGRDDLALAALHHDSHEAYTCDVPRPLKGLLSEYSRITRDLDRAIAEHLNLELPEKGTPDGNAIKRADDAVLRIEAESLLSGGVDGLLLDPGALSPDERALDAARAGVDDVDDPWSCDEAADRLRGLHNALQHT